jgi:hypothetical protein
LSDVTPECIIDQPLIAATTGAVDLLAKPSQNIVIQADSDSCFALGTETTDPRFALAKSYSAFILVPRIDPAPAVLRDAPK